MAHTLIRIAAGLGIAATVTVSAGLGAVVASADPGGSRSPSSHSRDAAPSRSEGDGGRGLVRGSYDGDRGGDHRRHAPRHPGRFGLWNPRGGTDASPDVVAGGVITIVPVAQAAAASRPGLAESTTSDPATDTDSDTDTDIRPSRASRDGSSGRDHGTRTVTPISVPRVTFGDDRSPRHRQAPAEDLVAAEPASVLPVPAVAAPAPPLYVPPVQPVPAAPPPAPVQASVPRIQWSPNTPVTSLWGRVQSGWPAGVIFGIAGLLMAPIGGIWLGQRQARASRTVSQLVSS